MICVDRLWNVRWTLRGHYLISVLRPPFLLVEPPLFTPYFTPFVVVAPLFCELHHLRVEDDAMPVCMDQADFGKLR